MNAKIISSGSYLPSKILTNFDLEKVVDTSDEWILKRTGISERRIAQNHETTVFMACEALKHAIYKGNIDAQNIDMVIVATSTPDRKFPSVAFSVKKELGIINGSGFDIQVACSGFVYAMSIADSMIKTNKANGVSINEEKITAEYAVSKGEYQLKIGKKKMFILHIV